MKTLNNTLIGLLIIIITLFSCKKEVINGTNGIDGKDGVCKGKVEVYFTGSITDAEAAEKVKNDIGHLTQKIYVTNTSNLTQLDLSVVKELVEIIVSNNSVLQSINLSKLEVIYKNLYVYDNLNLLEVNLEKLKTVETLVIGRVSIPSSNSINSLNLNSLEEVQTLQIGNTKLTSLNLPNLHSSFGGISIAFNSKLGSLNLPNLTKSNPIQISENKLSALSLPLIQEGSIVIYSESLLTSVSFPNINKIDNLVVGDGTKLSSTSVNSLLYQLLTITPQLRSSYIYLSGQNPAAPPTGSSVSHKNTLINLGNTVLTD